MARVKFIRDEEPNIRSLETNGGAIDGALYVATDTGNMWMGTYSNALLKLSNPVVVEVNSTASKVTQEQYDTIAASWPNVVFKFNYKSGYSNEEVYLPSKRSLNTDFIFFRVDYTQKLDLNIPQVTTIIIHKNLSISSKIITNLSVATSKNNYGIMRADAKTLGCDDNGKISVKDGGITSTKLADGAVTTAKIADGAVTKAKLGSDIVIPTTKADIGLENVDNTADANKSVKYATSAGSANTASVANSVAWNNVTGAPTIPTIESITDTEIDTLFTQVFG